MGFMKVFSMTAVAIVMMAAGCSVFTASPKVNGPQTPDPAGNSQDEAWIATPEAVFGARLGATIDEDMDRAGIKFDRDDDTPADVYHLPCSALRRPDYQFPSVGALQPRCDFYPCQVWVDRETRQIVQIVASPVAGANDEERDARAQKLCARFERAFGKPQRERGRSAPYWRFSFKDSHGQECRAVLKCAKSDRDGLWSFHLLVHSVEKPTSKTQPAQMKKRQVTSFGLFNKCRDKVAILKVGKGSATGFIVRDGGKCWLYTNEHVMRDGGDVKARTGDGKALTPGAMQLASDRDLLRYELTGEHPAFELAKESPDLQTEICVVGNSDGGGVFTELCGCVLGVGPDKIEIDAEFVKGNSGSPVFTRDMKVVGVATSVSRPSTSAESGWVSSDTRFAHVRRYALRTDNVRWVPVDRELYLRIVRGDGK